MFKLNLAAETAASVTESVRLLAKPHAQARLTAGVVLPGTTEVKKSADGKSVLCRFDLTRLGQEQLTFSFFAEGELADRETLSVDACDLAGKLGALASAAPEEGLQIGTKEGRLVVSNKSAAFEMSLLSQPSDLLPEITPKEALLQAAMAAGDFSALLAQGGYSTGDSGWLKNVTFFANPDAACLQAASTNGRAIAVAGRSCRYFTPESIQGDESDPRVAATKAMAATQRENLLAVWDGEGAYAFSVAADRLGVLQNFLKGEEQVQILLTTGRIVLRAGSGAVFYSAVLADEKAPYSLITGQIKTVDAKSPLVFDKATFVARLGCLLAGTTKLDSAKGIVVSLKTKGNNMLVSSTASGQAVIPIKGGTPEGVGICFDIKYLLSAAKALEGEEIILALNPGQATMPAALYEGNLEQDGRAKALSIVMPVNQVAKDGAKASDKKPAAEPNETPAEAEAE